MLNTINLMERLTANPELRQTPSGISVCRFTIAVDRPYQKDKEKKTDFFQVVVWRKSAEFVHKYFCKGNMIIVEGRLQNDNYTDQNGIKHYGTEVAASSVQFGESKAAHSASQSANTNAPQPTQASSTTNNPPVQMSAPSTAIEIADLGEFEEILSDGEVPF